MAGAYAHAVPTASDEAICIRHWDWSETSQTVCLLTRTHGVVRGLAKGSRRERSRFSGGFEVLTRGQALFILKAGSELATLTEWDLAEVFPVLRRDLRSFYAGMYLADLLLHSIRDHDPHPGAFDAALLCLRSLGPPPGGGGPPAPPPRPPPRPSSRTR
jgi:DNA repair protein RecO (recombination protein O)